MNKLLLVPLVLAMLSGCSYQLQLMPRDSGKVYTGTASGAPGGGSGPMSITIDGTAFNGSWTASRPGDSTSLLSAYGRNNRGGSASVMASGQTFGGTAVGRALLSSGSRGLRCEFNYGSAGSGDGVCQDDTGRVYDLQIFRQ